MCLSISNHCRFETQIKICLSISNHHPEHWQPFWSVRTAFVALIAFMPTNPNGPFGSLDCNKEARSALSIKSREAAPRFGIPEHQKLIDEIHEYMLSKEPRIPQLHSSENSEEQSPKTENKSQPNSMGAGVVAVATGEGLPVPAGGRIIEEVQEVPANANPRPMGIGTSIEIPANG